MSVDRLLAGRLVFVAGKGGVGRTTVAAALGLAAAGRGLRTIVAVVGGRDDLPGMLGVPTAGRGAASSRSGERELEPGLWSIGIEPQRAMEEYLRDQLPVAAVADLLSSSRTFGYLAAATPGLRELLTVGKIWELAQPARRVAGGEPYDLVIVDAPATGYGLSLLGAPRTFANVARRGPISRHAATIHATLVDPGQTGVLGVCTADEPAVGEVLETGERLRAELEIELGAVVVNAVHPRRFKVRDRAGLRGVLSGELTPGTGRAVELALAGDDRVRVERTQLRRLADAVGERPVELPLIGCEELGRTELGRLAELLGRAG
jgi:hypothetical protein